MSHMGDLVFEEFFAPASTDMVSTLVAEYKALRQRIDVVAEFIADHMNGGVIHYFLEGNASEERGRISLHKSASQLFDPAGAALALNSAYWSKAIQMTDVIDYMPQARRDEWNSSISYPNGKKKDRNKIGIDRHHHPEWFDEYGSYIDEANAWEFPPLPEFDEETVRSTLLGLLNMRSKFLAERVDGIFRGLSGEHVTNSPAAFGKRMILARVLSEHHSENHSMCGLINDLRCVIAKFMGRDEPKHYVSSQLVSSLKGRWGEWVTVDGGALRIRLYKKGTAHLEVHPDMAWRLNATLAALYPMAIPPEFRTKPKRKAKEFQMMQRPLPFAVVNLLADCKRARRGIKQEDNWRNPFRWEEIPNAVDFDRYGYNWEKAGKEAVREAESVLEAIGGVKTKEGWYQFDYYALDIIKDIVVSGCIPDHKSHQFYPTNDTMADNVVELADIKPEHSKLEPSAGTGQIAKRMGDGVQCVEISKAHCAILEAQGLAVDCADFMAWDGGRFDRICMNPPFSQGRAVEHVTKAATNHLSPGGVLVAIIPASNIGKTLVEGMEHEYTKPFDNEFKGASISVTILKLTARK